VDASGWLDVRYTTDGTDPLSGGRRYDGPLLLPAGDLQVRVAAERSDGPPLRAAVDLSAAAHGEMDGGPRIETHQGTYADEISLTVPHQGSAQPQYLITHHSLEQAAPLPDGDGFRTAPTTPQVLRPITGAIRGVVAHIRVGERLYRYQYLLDGRPPRAPEITRVGDRYVFSHRPATTTLYSLGEQEQASRGGAPLTVADVREAGGTLTTRSVHWDGRTSAGTSVSLSQTTPPSPPQVSVTAEPLRGLQVTAPSGAAGWAYRVVEPERGQPGNYHAGTGLFLELSAPRGYEGSIAVDVVSRGTDGSLSEPVRRELAIDTRPPEPPRITIEETTVALEGEGTLRYRLRTDRSAPGGSTAEPAPDSSVSEGAPRFKRYTSAIEIAPPLGGLSVSTVEAFSVDSVGNRSRIVRERVTVDRRPALLPRIIGVTDGERYDEPVTLWYISSDLPPELRYEVTTDGSEPPAPGPDSPQVGEGVTFSGSPGETVTVRLKLQPVTLTRNGNVRSLSFTIDREAPPSPSLSGVTENRAYRSERRISLETGDEDRQVLVTLARGGRPREFLYREPFIVPLREGETDTVTLSAQSLDEAGNMSDPRTVSFTMDGVPPATPALCVRTGSPQGTTAADVSGTGGRSQEGSSQGDTSREGTSQGESTSGAGSSFPPASECDVTVSAEAAAPGQPTVTGRAVTVSPLGDGTRYFYQVESGRTPDTAQESRGNAGTGSTAENGGTASSAEAAPAQPGQSSWHRFNEPLTFDTSSGTERSLRFYLKAVDEAGNESNIAGPFDARIDKSSPSPPPPPRLSRSAEDTYEASWPAGTWSLESVEYRREGDSSFETYRGPPVDVDPDTVLEYRSVDRAGNSSRIRRISAGVASQTAPRLSGAREDGVYRSGVDLSATGTNAGQARYEVAVNGSAVPEVTEQSPRLTEASRFDTPDGTETTYTVHVRSIDEEGRRSPLIRRRFTVDRQAPAPPRLTSVPDGAYVSRPTEISFARQEATVWYAVQETVQYGPQDGRQEEQSTGFLRADQSRSAERPSIDPVEGTRVRYRIEAYAEDEAGNRSETRAWEVFADAAVVYVAETGSDTNGTGSRQEPFRSLGAALTQAENLGRGTIFLGTGTYSVEDSLIVPAGLNVTGGFSPDTWRAGEGTSIISLEQGQSAGPAFRAEAGEVRFERLTVVGTGPLAMVSGAGSLAFEHVEVELNGEGRLFEQRGGSLRLSESSLSARGTLLDMENGRAEISQSSVEGVTTLLNARGDARVVISQSDIDSSKVSAGAEAYARMIGGRLSIRDSVLLAPRGGRVVQISAQDASVELADADLVGNGETDISIMLSLQASDLSMAGGTVTLAGRTGVVGIRSDSSRVTIDGARIDIEQMGRFGYALTLRNSSGTVQNSVLRTRTEAPAGGGTVIGARLVDDRTAWLFNTFSLSGEPATAFNIEGRSRTTMVGNQLAGANGGNAIYRSNQPGSIIVRYNCFDGWDAPLAWPLAQGSSPGALGTVDTVDALNTASSLDDVAFGLSAGNNRPANGEGSCEPMAGMDQVNVELPQRDRNGNPRPGSDGRYSFGAAEE
jgi:hypothetical protein